MNFMSTILKAMHGSLFEMHGSWGNISSHGYNIFSGFTFERLISFPLDYMAKLTLKIKIKKNLVSNLTFEQKKKKKKLLTFSFT